MSIFGGQKKASQPPDFSGLAIQTATTCVPIPILYGVARGAPNIIWRDGAMATPNPGGGSYHYSTWIMYALGEGPIAAVDLIYNGQTVSVPGGYYDHLTLFNGATPQALWAPLTTSFPNAALNYNGTAYMASSYFDLGSTSNLPPVSFEIQGRFATQSAVNGIDADPTDCILDFLTNPQYGVGFPQTSIDLTTLSGTSGDASYRSYVNATGLAFSASLSSQESANAILARWLEITNTAAVWSGGRLKFIPYGDTPITTAQQNIVLPYLVAIGNNTTANTQYYKAFPYQVAPTSRFIADNGVTMSSTGAAMTKVSGIPAQGQYSLSGSTYSFASQDVGQAVQIAYTVVPAGAFTPNATPVYDLSDNDFIYEDGNDPVEVARTDPYGLANTQRMEVFDRNKQYAATPVEVRDQGAIEAFGLRVGSTITAHEFCDLGMGLISAQLVLQRALYTRNTYSFKLSWECCLLEPMDIVTLTDPGLGLARTPVRIVAIEEDADGLLAVTAEDYPGNLSTLPAQQQAQISAATIVNQGAPAVPVNAPILFEPPAQLTGGSEQIWMAVSGATGGANAAAWGGANVFVSVDGGASFNQVGTIRAKANQGALSTALPAFSGTSPDVVNTLAVDLTQSLGTLASGSAADARNAVTLCIVERELVAFQTATLTAANQYALTTLYRGLYGSKPVAHAAAAPFARLDAAVFVYTPPSSAIGTTLFVKLQSVNVYGGGVQDIATCVAYPVPLVGSGVQGPTAQEIATGTSFDEGLASQPVTQSDDYGVASDPYTQALDEGLATEIVQSLALAAGGTGATTAAGARTNIGAAAAGANADITSLTGLTTALGVAQGGTGSTTAPAARTALGAAASGANGDITSLSTVIKIAGAASAPRAITIDPTTGHVGLSGYTADANNGLGVLGTSFLFAAAVDSCRFTFNKAAPANDCSLTFETNYSARALAGLLGSDSYQLKVSADGSTFRQVYAADQSTGNLAVKALISLASYTVATLPAGLNGALAFASNGRKTGEAAGAGTGVVAAFSNGQWRRLSDDSAVAA